MKNKLNDMGILKRLHLLIIAGWLLPYITMQILPQFVTPFIVTVLFLILDVVVSIGDEPYDAMVPRIIWTNLAGMVIATLGEEISNYAFGQDPNFGPGMGIIFAGIWDIVYLVLLIAAVALGFSILKVKKRASSDS